MPQAEKHHGSLPALALAALGVVFGDIGTSPLYAMKECVSGPHAVGVNTGNVLGLLSLIFWALTMVVTLKYLTFVMRAHNRGQGGVLALLALIPGGTKGNPAGRIGIPALGALILLGAGLDYGDGLITPAISVLSAIEGLTVAAPGLQSAVVPITCGILLGLFLIQKRGTGSVGNLFGPVMVVWFVTIAVLGLRYVFRYPDVLRAISPHYAVSFFIANKGHGFLVLGSVVLAITGGEALYADMGHFGRNPIRFAWLVLAFPSLLFCYLGQGALLLHDPSAAANPFFALVPQGPMTYVLVVLAAMATVIASQALISGIFSLTHQAVQLGLFPRVTVRHTSHSAEGQIYIPEVNWALALACITLVVAFKESTRLAAAYGVAVTGAMSITSIAFYNVARKTWGWSRWKALPLLLAFLAFEIPLFSANIIKFFDGGYIPIIVGALFFYVMITWKRGRSLLGKAFAEMAITVEELLARVERDRPARVKGACVFMASASHVPPILVHHLRHNQVLHETVILLTVSFEHDPRVDDERRVESTHLGAGIHRLIVRYGYMEEPDIPAALRLAAGRLDISFDPDQVTYYLGRETLLATNRGFMKRGQESFFAFLSRNALGATAYFRIPADRVVELGLQLDL